MQSFSIEFFVSLCHTGPTVSQPQPARDRSRQSVLAEKRDSSTGAAFGVALVDPAAGASAQLQQSNRSAAFQLVEGASDLSGK